MGNSTLLVVFEQVDEAFIPNPVLAVPGDKVLVGLRSQAGRHRSGRVGGCPSEGAARATELLAPIHDHGADAAGAQVGANRGADERDWDILDGRATRNAGEQFLAERLDIRA